MHYPWHPSFGKSVEVVYREQRKGEQVAICTTTQGANLVIPAWMLDAEACVGMTLGSRRASLGALLDLRRVLDVLGSDRPDAPVGGKEVDREKSEATRSTGNDEPRPDRALGRALADAPDRRSRRTPSGGRAGASERSARRHR